MTRGWELTARPDLKMYDVRSFPEGVLNRSQRIILGLERVQHSDKDWKVPEGSSPLHTSGVHIFKGFTTGTVMSSPGDELERRERLLVEEDLRR